MGRTSMQSEVIWRLEWGNMEIGVGERVKGDRIKGWRVGEDEGVLKEACWEEPPRRGGQGSSESIGK
ncbi:hypothetical protein AMTR_s00006p00263290 [Amborella trichopoda]|uniref:Uncharacterized protein n=1 Tax=Amborella trichopoda TaxID=13333 RepID=W1PFK9_AMBTC|nr:hypothetical protein AMTR_s00006p00263290 [Amborella trichopoda]